MTLPLQRSEEHTSELQSRTLISYAVFCLKKKKPRVPVVLRMQTGITSLSSCQHIGDTFFFFFNETATTEIYTSVHTLSLHDALPISKAAAILYGSTPMSTSRVTAL